MLNNKTMTIAAIIGVVLAGLFMFKKSTVVVPDGVSVLIEDDMYIVTYEDENYKYTATDTDLETALKSICAMAAA